MLKRPKLKIPVPKLRRTPRKMPEPGARPGTIASTEGAAPPVFTRFEYCATGVEQSSFELDELEGALQPTDGKMVWIDVNGVGDVVALRKIGELLGLHPLTLEDIAHVHQRPKVEDFDDYLLTVVRSVRVLDGEHVDNEQLSFILKGNVLVTFQERLGDGFEPVRQRLRDGKGPMRTRGVDYLFYALLDTVIDNYFPVIEVYGEAMEALEEEIREHASAALSRNVHAYRKELRALRRAIWPLRDVTALLGRNEIERIDSGLRASFRDCYDHAIQLSDFVQSGRERASDLSDLYQLMVSEKTNQVMKTLTIVATIFIPLTFLCGLYGMNFDPEVSPYNMPELKWRYGYPAFWGFMLTTFGAMVWYFRRQGWLGRDG